MTGTFYHRLINQESAKTGVPEKKETLEAHMVSTPEVETGPHMWEARLDCSDHCATLAPHSHPCT